MSTGKTVFYPQVVKVVKINQFKIVDVKIDLFKSASYTALLYDVDDNLCDSRFYTLTEDEYSQWYNDDNYLIKITKDKLQQESNN
jgi:predicted HAD superfamily phosphohydrolase YqeG